MPRPVRSGVPVGTVGLWRVLPRSLSLWRVLPSDFFHALEKEGFSTIKEAHEAALTVEDYAELGVTDPVQVGNLRALISDEYDRERGLGTPDQVRVTLRKFGGVYGVLAEWTSCPCFHPHFSRAMSISLTLRRPPVPASWPHATSSSCASVPCAPVDGRPPVPRHLRYSLLPQFPVPPVSRPCLVPRRLDRIQIQAGGEIFVNCRSALNRFES